MTDPSIVEAMWSPWERAGSEHLRLAIAEEVQADGVVLSVGEDGRPFRIRYRIRCDMTWRVRRFTVDPLDSRPGVDLRADGRGNWTTAGGDPVPDLEGCVDVDVSVTPFTNTLPIRRLQLAVGESSEVRVVYVEALEVQLTASTQRYTRLGERYYRFESLEVDCTADLPVDREGLVLDYPGLFRRTYRTA